MKSATLRRFAEPLHELIREAYKSKELAKVLYFHLKERLDTITSEQNDFDAVVFDLVLWADLHGRFLELARAVSAERPDVSDLAQLGRVDIEIGIFPGNGDACSLSAPVMEDTRCPNATLSPTPSGLRSRTSSRGSPATRDERPQTTASL